MSRRNTIMVQRTYYQMGMVTLFSVLLWVSVSVYLALLGSSDVGVDKDTLSPITPFSDSVTVASISARRQLGISAPTLVKDLVIASASAEPTPTPVPTASPAPTASPSASLSPSPTASGAAETL